MLLFFERNGVKGYWRGGDPTTTPTVLKGEQEKKFAADLSDLGIPWIYEMLVLKGNFPQARRIPHESETARQRRKHSHLSETWTKKPDFLLPLSGINPQTNLPSWPFVTIEMINREARKDAHHREKAVTEYLTRQANIPHLTLYHGQETEFIENVIRQLEIRKANEKYILWDIIAEAMLYLGGEVVLKKFPA